MHGWASSTTFLPVIQLRWISLFTVGIFVPYISIYISIYLNISIHLVCRVQGAWQCSIRRTPRHEWAHVKVRWYFLSQLCRNLKLMMWPGSNRFERLLCPGAVQVFPFSSSAKDNPWEPTLHKLACLKGDCMFDALQQLHPRHVCCFDFISHWEQFIYIPTFPASFIQDPIFGHQVLKYHSKNPPNSLVKYRAGLRVCPQRDEWRLEKARFTAQTQCLMTLVHLRVTMCHVKF